MDREKKTDVRLKPVLRLAAATEQVDSLEHGVAHGAAAGDQHILRSTDAEQAMGVGGRRAPRAARTAFK